MAKHLAITGLPDTAFSRICQILDVPDVLSFAHTCTSLYTSVTQDSLLWKRHCSRDFVCEAVSAEGARTWYQQWLDLCKEFGRYRACYAQVKSAWNEIEAVLRQRCTQAWSELMASGAASEAELDDLERRLEMKLPDDYRCSLRIHGKLSVSLGTVSYLMKSYRTPDEMPIQRQTFRLFGVRETSVEAVRPGRSKLHIAYVALAENVSSIPTKSRSAEPAKEFLLMVSSGEAAAYADCPLGQVFIAFSSPIRYGYGLPGGCCVDMSRLYEWFRMPGSATYADWLSAEADRMKYYYVTSQKKQLTRFILKPECVAATNYITVRIATAALSEYSNRGWKFNEPEYVALLLIVELSKDAQTEDSCQVVQDCLLANGERVDPSICSFVPSPSLITLHPGDLGEYLSLPLPTTRDTVVEGHLVMQTVPGNTEFLVNLPQVSIEEVSAERFPSQIHANP